MSDEIQKTGTVLEIGDLTVDRGYHQRTIVIGTGGRYPTSLQVRFSDKSGDTAAKLDGVSVGDRVSLTFDVTSRKSQSGDKWFTNADGWDCEILARGKRTTQRPRNDDGPPPPLDSDLPF